MSESEQDKIHYTATEIVDCIVQMHRAVKTFNDKSHGMTNIRNACDELIKDEAGNDELTEKLHEVLKWSIFLMAKLEDHRRLLGYLPPQSMTINLLSAVDADRLSMKVLVSIYQELDSIKFPLADLPQYLIDSMYRAVVHQSAKEEEAEEEAAHAHEVIPDSDEE